MASTLLHLAYQSECPSQMWAHLPGNHVQSGANDDRSNQIRHYHHHQHGDTQQQQQQHIAKLRCVRERKLATTQCMRQRLQSIEECIAATKTTAEAGLMRAKANYQATKLKVAELASNKLHQREQILLSDWTGEAHKRTVCAKQAQHLGRIGVREALERLEQQYAWQRCALRLSAEMDVSYGAPVYCEFWTDPNAGEPATPTATTMTVMMMVEEVWRKHRSLQDYRPKEMLRATIGEHVVSDGSAADSAAAQFVLSSCRICEDLPSLAEATTLTVDAAEDDPRETRPPNHTVQDTPTEQLLSAEVVRWLLPPSMQLSSSRMYACLEEWLPTNDDDKEDNDDAAVLAQLAECHCDKGNRPCSLHPGNSNSNTCATRVQVVERCGDHRSQPALAAIPDVLRGVSIVSEKQMPRHLHFMPATVSYLLSTKDMQLYVACTPSSGDDKAELLVPLSSACTTELAHFYFPGPIAAATSQQRKRPSFVDMLPKASAAGEADAWAVLTFTKKPADSGGNSSHFHPAIVKYMARLQPLEQQQQPPQPHDEAAEGDATFCAWFGCVTRLQPPDARFCAHHARLRAWVDGKPGRHLGWRSSNFTTSASESVVQQFMTGNVRAHHMDTLQRVLQQCVPNRQQGRASWRRWEDQALFQQMVSELDWQAAALQQIASMESQAKDMLCELLSRPTLPRAEIVALFREARMLLAQGLPQEQRGQQQQEQEGAAAEDGSDVQRIEDEQWRVHQKLRMFERFVAV